MLWGYWRRTASNSGAVWFADFHIVASQYARQGFALAIPSSEGSDTDKKGDDL